MYGVCILYMCLYSFAFSNKTINHVLKYYEISFIVHALSLPLFLTLLSIIIKVVNHVRRTEKKVTGIRLQMALLCNDSDKTIAVALLWKLIH